MTYIVESTQPSEGVLGLFFLFFGVLELRAVGICDGAHLCLHVGGPPSQRDTLHKESHGDMDKNSLSFIQPSILIISQFKFKLREFDPTYYPYHLSIRT